MRVFKSGISNGSAPVRYLLGNTDHKGSLRKAEPEVLLGDPKITISVIDNISRKHKYISGCLSFRDSEHPTKNEMHEIIQDFKNTILPGLDDNNYNSLFVLHQDKGNTEIHFVIPTQELKTGKRLNPHPPGKLNIELYETFTKVTNQKMGYEQVVPDPFKIALTECERKSPEFKKDKSNKTWLHSKLISAINNGTLTDREQLCDFLTDEFGITVTRKGQDYISVKYPGSHKAKRLKGNIYSAEANYSNLLKEFNASKKSKYLSNQEFDLQRSKLNHLVTMRAAWNESAYLKKSSMRKYAKAIKTNDTIKTSQIKTITRRTTMKKNLTAFKKIGSEAIDHKEKAKKTDLMQKPQVPFKVSIKNKIDQIRQESWGIPIPSANSSSTYSLDLSIAAFENSLHETITKLNNCKNPAQKAELEKKIYDLKRQLELLRNQKNLHSFPTDSQQTLKKLN